MKKFKMLFLLITALCSLLPAILFAQQGTMSWIQATASAGWSARQNHTSVVFDNKIWVIGGWDGTRKNDVWYSTDGVNWTQATASAGWTARDNHTSVVYDNKMWVMGGWDQIGAIKNDVWYSTDGINWIQATTNAGWSTRYQHTSVVFDNKIWVMGGGTPASYKNDVWYSSDGVTWTQATANAGWSVRYSHTSVTFDNKIWVMGGFDGTNRFRDVWYSSDGVNWTRATANAGWSARSDHTSVVFDNNIWVIGGGFPYLRDVWYSSDGATWKRATSSAGWSARYYHSSVVFENKIWVMGGYDGNNKRDVWYSRGVATLISPNGSEFLRGGSNQIIKWLAVATGFIHFRLLLSRTGGSTYADTIADNVMQTETTYNWLVPYLNLNQCRVRVQVLDSGGSVILQDASDGSFTIDSEQPSIFSLINPINGGWANGRPIFSWTPATDNYSFSHYQIFIDGNLRRDSIFDTFCYLTWAQVCDSAGWSARQNHTSVVFGNKIWVIGGYDGSYRNDVWYSIDGVNWTQATANAAWTARSGHTSLIFDNKIWVIGGSDGSILKNDVWYSSDGINWTQATANAGWSARRGHTSIVFDNKIWVIGGVTLDNPPTRYNDVWYSSDGINWTQATANAGWSARGYHTSIVTNNVMWVMGGEEAGWHAKNDVWYSINGVNWIQATANAGWSARRSHSSFVFNDKMWVIGGYSGDYRSDVWYSINGIIWSQVNENANWSIRGLHTSVLFDDKMWILGGNHIGYLMQDIWKSIWAIEPSLTEDWRTWYVKAFDKAGNWRQSTEVFTVGIDTTLPNAFSLSHPDNNDTVYLQQPRLYWHHSIDALSGIRKYQLWINGVLNRDSVPATDTSATPISSLQNYSSNTWHVKAFDMAGNIQTSNQVWSFIVIKDSSPPTVPILISPFNNSVIQETLPRFYWQSSLDNLSGVDHYQLQYATDSDFTGVISVNVTDTSYQVPSRLDDTTYYWRVQAVDRAGNQSDWSMVWSFEIDTRIPNVPVLNSPINGVWLTNLSVIFNWSQVNFNKNMKLQIIRIDIDNTKEIHRSSQIISDDFTFSSVRYILQVDTSTNFTNPIMDTTDLVYDTLILPQTRYFWKVRAYDMAGNQGIFSNPDSFGVDVTAPSVPVLLSPANNTTLNDSFVRFYWHRSTDSLSGVRNYQIQIANDSGFSNPIDTAFNDTTLLRKLRDTTYYWRVKSIDRANNESNWSTARNFRVRTTGIEEIINATIPFEFSLAQNTPNPFSEFTEIRYGVPYTAKLDISIFDITGNEIITLVNSNKNAGWYTIRWGRADKNGKHCPSGIYILRLKTNEIQLVKKILLMK